jgi:hypothetical protein
LIDLASKVVVQPVKVSRQIGNEVVIAAGVKPGDQVITEIPQALEPGSTVRPAGAESKGGETGKGGTKGGKKLQGKSEG